MPCELQKTDEEACKYLIKKLGETEKYTAAVARMGLFNLYARVNQEYDRLSEQTNHQLSLTVLNLVKKQVKSFAELGRSLIEFEQRRLECKDTTGTHIDPSLKKSAFISIIDSETEIPEMRRQFTALMCNDLDADPVLMDISAIEPTKIREPAFGPCAESPFNELG